MFDAEQLSIIVWNCLSCLFAEILRGGVKFLNNKLCNVETIQWFDIVNADTKPSMELQVAGNNPLCKCFHSQHKEKKAKPFFLLICDIFLR